MSSSRRLRFTLTWLAVALAQAARAAGGPPPLVVEEPEVVVDPATHLIQTQDDGSATVRLRWPSPGAPAGTVSLWISPLRAAGQAPVNAAIEPGAAPGGGIARALRDVAMPAGGLDLKLSAPGLVPDVEYAATLTATVGNRALRSDLKITRPGSMPTFRCPAGRQLAQRDGMLALELAPLARVDGRSIDLRLSNFVASDGQSAVVAFDGPPPGGLRQELSGLPLDGAWHTPPVRAFGLAEGTVYAGTVKFLDGPRELMECPLEVVLPRVVRGELAADTGSLSRSVTLPFLASTDAVKLSLRLFEKTRSIAIHGVTPILDGAGEAPDGTFDLARHVGLALDPPDELRLEARAAPAERSLPVLGTLEPTARGNVTVSLRDLHAGKYAFALRFTATNATGPGPKVDVAINVRHHWAWALVAVAVALGLSFFINMGIGSWRDRRDMLDRVKRIEPRGDAKDLAAAVFLDAVCLRTEALIRSAWVLPLPASVADYVARAERVAEILKRHSTLQEILQTIPSGSLRYFCCSAIEKVMRRIGPEPLDQKTADEVVKELEALAASFDNLDKWYHDELSREAGRMRQSLEGKRFGLDSDHEKILDQLLAELRMADPFQTERSTAAFDRAYWVARLLVARERWTGEPARILDDYGSTTDPMLVFHKADESAWQRLREACRDHRIHIRPTDAPAAQVALHPLQFYLDFDDTTLDESYFVRSVLRYEWHFDFTPRPRLLHRRKRAPLRKDRPSEAPRITYLVPEGTLRVSVRISVPGNERLLPIPASADERSALAEEFSIGPDREDRLRSADWTQLALTGCLGLVALVTSMPALYFSKPTFGTFADYMAILVWAVGLDVGGKTLIQQLGSRPAGQPSAQAKP